MIVSLRHFLGWLVSSFSCRVDLVLENLALRRQLLAARATTSPSIDCRAQTVLGCVENGLVRVEPASRATLRRHPSEIGAVCANERPYGSVRGASGNRCPYRDRSSETIARPLLRWTFSPSQRSLLVFCTAFSSSATIVGASCISM